MSGLLVLLALCAIGTVIYLFVESNTHGKDVVRTTLPASQIMRQAIQEIGAERKWTATGHSQDFANFSINRRASCLVAILLAFFWIIPGVLYMLLGGKTQTLSLNIFPEPDGTNTVQASSSGGEAKRRGRRFLRGLPQQPALTPQEAAVVPSLAPEGASTPILPPPAPPAALPPVSVPVDSTREETTAALEDAEAIHAEVSASTVFCEHCGTAIGATNRFCPSCGKEQSAVK